MVLKILLKPTFKKKVPLFKYFFLQPVSQLYLKEQFRSSSIKAMTIERKDKILEDKIFEEFN